MARPAITVRITVNEKSHTCSIVYQDARGLQVATRNFRVQQGPGGVQRTLARLVDGVTTALLFAEEELGAF